MNTNLDKNIIELSNISNKINNQIFDKKNLEELNKEHSNLILFIKLLMQENNLPIKNNYNSNLFYHSWIFNEEEFGVNSEKYNKCGKSFIKHPYIGLFHPFGSIYTIEKNSNILNNLIKTQQHIHQPSHYSPDNSHIFIDLDKYGKAYSVCVNYEKIEDCKSIESDKIKGRVDLLIYSPINIKFIQKDYESLSVSQLIKKLAEIKELEPLLNTIELESVKEDSNIKKISDIIGKEFTYWGYDSLILFRYKDHDRYPILLNYNLPIESDKIPYINEIKSKLDDKIRDKIEWEFGIIITTKI